MKATPAVNKVVNQVPTLALRGITVFPGALFHFDVGRQKSIRFSVSSLEGNAKEELPELEEIP